MSEQPNRFLAGCYFGLGALSTVLLISVAVAGAISYLCPGFFWWMLGACLQQDGNVLKGMTLTVSNDVLYAATISYYNQLVAILVFLIGLAGALVFIYVGKMSSERAEDKAKDVAQQAVTSYLRSHEFHTKIEQVGGESISEFVGQSVGTVGEQLETIFGKINSIEEKYDRHDEKIQAIEDRVKVGQDVEVDNGSDT